MGVAVHLGRKAFEIGSPSSFHSFFSTVAVRLENEKWGSRFPVLMKKFYSGELPFNHARQAATELAIIQEELRQFPPNAVVWDIENRHAKPPWGEDISKEITSLANYFVTSDGKDLITVLLQAFDKASKSKTHLTIM